MNIFGCRTLQRKVLTVLRVICFSPYDISFCVIYLIMSAQCQITTTISMPFVFIIGYDIREDIAKFDIVELFGLFEVLLTCLLDTCKFCTEYAAEDAQRCCITTRAMKEVNGGTFVILLYLLPLGLVCSNRGLK